MSESVELLSSALPPGTKVDDYTESEEAEKKSFQRESEEEEKRRKMEAEIKEEEMITVERKKRFDKNIITKDNLMSLSLDLFALCQEQSIPLDWNPLMDKSGNTLLHLLILRREWSKACELLQNLRQHKRFGLMNDTNHCESTALSMCATLRDSDMLALMIGYGCDISAGYSPSNQTAFNNSFRFDAWSLHCFVDGRKYNHSLPKIGDHIHSVHSYSGRNTKCKSCKLSPSDIFANGLKSDESVIHGDKFIGNEDISNVVICFYQRNGYSCHSCFTRYTLIKQKMPSLRYYLGLTPRGTADSWTMNAWEQGKKMKQQCINLDLIRDELNKLEWIPLEISGIIVEYCEEEPTYFESEASQSSASDSQCGCTLL